jgi:cytidine deaminase
MKTMRMTAEQHQNLVRQAVQARRMAYAPYSHYPVGAALLTDQGDIFTGVNVENAAYPTTMCAERVAVFKAVSEGQRNFVAVAVATANGGTPCGACRQVLSEFSLEALVLVVDQTGKVVLESSVAELLPGAFRPQDLQGGS